MRKLLAALIFLLFVPIVSHEQAYNGQGTQGPIQYHPNCAQALRYGTLSVCYDTTLNAWYFWNYKARSGKGAFTPISPSNGAIDVASLGAVCDGTTDDTAALQTAMDLCSGNSLAGGKSVNIVFPAGKFCASQPGLNIQNGTGCLFSQGEPSEANNVNEA